MFVESSDDTGTDDGEFKTAAMAVSVEEEVGETREFESLVQRRHERRCSDN